MSQSASHEFPDFGAIPNQGVKPLAALRAAVRLFLDTQDTEQVALLEMAVGGYLHADILQRFFNSETGRAVIRERRSPVELLDDREYLRTLPANSLGRHYLAHMEREGLTVKGLMEATPAVSAYFAQQSQAIQLFVNYAIRCGHDLHHVIAGYGRDELGEACVLAMGYEHLRIRGYKVIFTVGPFAVRKQLRRLKIDPRGVFAAVREARRIGRQATWLPALDIPAILGEDLTALRTRLNIQTPLIYNEIISRVHAGSAWRDGPLVHAPSPPRKRRLPFAVRPQRNPSALR